jgi:hypothetical protein
VLILWFNANVCSKKVEQTKTNDPVDHLCDEVYQAVYKANWFHLLCNTPIKFGDVYVFYSTSINLSTFTTILYIVFITNSKQLINYVV